MVFNTRSTYNTTPATSDSFQLNIMTSKHIKSSYSEVYFNT